MAQCQGSMIEAINIRYTRLRNMLWFHLIFCCGNFVERYSFRIARVPEAMRKLCLSTKFPHQKIRKNHSILRSASNRIFIYPDKIIIHLAFLFLIGTLIDWLLNRQNVDNWNRKNSLSLIVISYYVHTYEQLSEQLHFSVFADKIIVYLALFFCCISIN